MKEGSETGLAAEADAKGEINVIPPGDGSLQIPVDIALSDVTGILFVVMPN